MDLMCYRCNSRDLMSRGQLIGCNSCGLWLEKERYGSEALPLLKKQLELKQQLRKSQKKLEVEVPKQSAMRSKRKKTFVDPGGP